MRFKRHFHLLQTHLKIIFAGSLTFTNSPKEVLAIVHAKQLQEFYKSANIFH